MNKIETKKKKDFKEDLKKINKKADKLDPIFKEIFDKISLFFTFNIDKQIMKIIDDLSENIENPNLDPIIKQEIEELVKKFLSDQVVAPNSEQGNTQVKVQEKDEGEKLWEEKKKVRNAL